MKLYWKPGNGTIAILLAFATTILLTATSPTIGLTWDEPVYIASADSYAHWFVVLVKDPVRALSPATIDSYWIFEGHPPVEKIWSGLVWLMARYVFEPILANRLGPILQVAILVALLYLLLAGTYGKAAGLFAAAALMSLPRFFFHAHIAALDVPVATGSLAVIFLFWKTIDRKGLAWGLLWGVVWGLVVAIKINGVLIPIALIVWILIFRRKWSVVLRLVLMGIIAVLTFFFSWPWLYYDTWTRVMKYVHFNFNNLVGQLYFGQFYIYPPWHAVFVILWAVVPLTVMVLFMLGMLRAGKGKWDGGLAWLLILSVFTSILPFVFGRILLYDNERLFMPAFPFLCALAGIGFGWLVKSIGKLVERVKRPGLVVPATILLGIGLLTPQALAMESLYPHLLSYYSEGVGGLPGATKLGLETTYWCETYASAIPYINTHAKPGDVIWIDGGRNVLVFYQTIGQLRQDVEIPYTLKGQMILDANWYIFQYRQSQYGTGGEGGYLPLQILETQTPVYEVSYQGITLMKLYSALK